MNYMKTIFEDLFSKLKINFCESAATIEYTSFFKIIGMWYYKPITRTRLELLIESSNNFIVHIFYFYIFEKVELKTHFEHIGPIRIEKFRA